MSEEMKKVDVKVELNDDELEQVAGGYSADEIIVSKALAKTSGTCPNQEFNDIFWHGGN